MTLVDINGVRVDRIVAEQLPEIKNQVLNRDRDKHLLIDGREGSGKSVFAMQLAKALDNDFNIDKIAFSADGFIKLIKSDKIKKGDCILLDEAFSAASARASLSQINRAMMTVATEMRQLNLFIIIVLPSLFDLDRYFAIWRCDTLFHVYFNLRGDRGSYSIYPFEEKLKLYIHGKKTYNYYACSSPYPHCTFTNQWIVDEKEYRERKAEAFRHRHISFASKRWKERAMRAIVHLQEKEGYTYEEVGRIVSMSEDNIDKCLEKWRKLPPKQPNIIDTTSLEEEDDDEDDNGGKK